MLKQLEEIALSNEDILSLLNGKVKIVLYPDIYKYETIYDFLEPYGAVILLFESKPNYGHWCAIWKLNKYTISFFNSYGGYPDDSLRFIDKKFRIDSHQDFPYLSELLLNSPFRLTYNEYDYQELNKDIRTCGRWCVLRILLRHMDDEQFHNFIVQKIRKFNMTPDELVTVLTTI